MPRAKSPRTSTVPGSADRDNLDGLAQPPEQGTLALAVQPTHDDRREFRKTNDAIGLRVKEGKLSLLSRKIFNVLMFNAQEHQVPGKNAPLDTAVAQKYFWMPLAELARDANYDSKDTQLLKEHLREMQGIRMVLEDKRQWTSENLISSVKLVNPAGLKNKHAGKVWVGYAFPPEVHELVMSPGTYTKLSIFYQGLLRTGGGLALYEVCRKYLTNPSRLTNRDTYENWYVILSGNALAVGEAPPPYKYFKRDLLLKAIAEINALTDINVELIEHRAGRRISEIQFRVMPARGNLSAPFVAPFVDSELMGQLTEIGMSQQDVWDAVTLHGSAKLRQALRLLNARRQLASAEPLSSPLAYLRWTLKHGGDALKEPKAPKGQGPGAAEVDAGSELLSEFQSARARQAYAAYVHMPPQEQADVFSRFRAQSTHRSVKEAREPAGPMVRSLFSTWLAKDLYGEPSAAELAAYIAAQPLDLSNLKSSR